MNARTTVVLLVMVLAVLAAFVPVRPGEVDLVAAMQDEPSRPLHGHGT
jgi:hypothetical protein